ncbi:tRNA (N6-isopentenyl adenosine(37)-C2)-methylthiotransferase MiaB [Helicobacter monodelphidis]|uniref:tRNA (N6-isopentenyl adenosine(37)-C2)-methylthiotransferase MiaB n=1 Tax=Helicobacter sp. 15-1451 TaxID=2004995 RepID=UPI000DCF0BDE|nr:tRNA (N6-isopentenyl adenosine(37)-C2)-methylthiotransferase MiaB [Helicobacter sp. 15-1451]RAX58844.1 tRNA (N6-isopentenyl adenosine(37)-C2)-methylthiotransferase MiaB [Helicobacter sp. 15-1451]
MNQQKESAFQKKVFIETMGCAMNVKDTEHMLAELESKEGYKLTQNAKEADLILINTCSVREKPERKLFSEIGQYDKLKKKGAKIGVCGCTASHLGQEILTKSKAVSFVLGARNVSKITSIIHQEGAVEVDTDYDDSRYVFASNSSHSTLKAMVNISIGCDKQCTYCIVPHTRGEEISIPADIILKEVQKAVDDGAIEVLLLGQNVNNYGRRFSTEHTPMNFTQLLQEISKIDGLKRIRFTSPHPLQMDNAFLEEFANNPKICKSIHIPLQSGSDKILKLMKRGYTQDWYLQRIRKLRELIPSVSIGTDIIVAFPYEEEADFLETMRVLEEVRFDTMYSFIYSPRPHTEASRWGIQVNAEEALNRLIRLQNRHKEILEQNNAQEIGTVCEVLWENIREDGFLEGKSDHAKLVRAPFKNGLIGKVGYAQILDARRAYLIGEAI